MTIPAKDYGGSGKPLHLLHTNGYSPGCHPSLIDLMKAYHQVFVNKRNPHIQVITVENSTHLPPLEKPNEVFEHMQAFLTERT